MINTINDLLESSKPLQLVAVKVMLTILLCEIYDANKTVVRRSVSEELKLAVIQCIDTVFRRSSTDNLTELYTPVNAHLLSQICFVCVHMIGMESYKKLK